MSVRRAGAFEFLLISAGALALYIGVPLGAAAVGGSSPPVGCQSAPVASHSAPCPDGEMEEPEPVSFDETKISFQPRRAPVPAGYLVDSGRVYSGARGYGWRLGANDHTGRQCGDRNVISNQAHDTFCHAQGRHDLINGRWHFEPIPGLWEIAVPDAVYEVTLTVGESKFAHGDVSNSFDIEGVVAADNFAARNGTLQQTTTVTVSVQDGFLTVDPRRGSQGKIAAIIIKLAGPAAPVDPPAPTGPVDPLPVVEQGAVMQFNFGSKRGPTPKGWTAQNGMPYDVEAGHGWRAPGGGPVERRQCGVRNTSVNAVRDSFCHAQTRYTLTSGRWRAVDSPAIFEVALDPGTYRVTVSVGDPKYVFDDVSTSISVEGVTVFHGFRGLPGRFLAVRDVVVNVNDGHLTVDPTAGSRGKINYVTIEQLVGATGTIEVLCDRIGAAVICSDPDVGTSGFDITRPGVKVVSCAGTGGFTFVKQQPQTRCSVSGGSFDFRISLSHLARTRTPPCEGVEVGRVSFVHEPSGESAALVVSPRFNGLPCFTP